MILSRANLNLPWTRAAAAAPRSLNLIPRKPAASGLAPTKPLAIDIVVPPSDPEDAPIGGGFSKPEIGNPSPSIPEIPRGPEFTPDIEPGKTPDLPQSPGAVPRGPEIIPNPETAPGRQQEPPEIGGEPPRELVERGEDRPPVPQYPYEPQTSENEPKRL